MLLPFLCSWDLVRYWCTLQQPAHHIWQGGLGKLQLVQPAAVKGNIMMTLHIFSMQSCTHCNAVRIHIVNACVPLDGTCHPLWVVLSFSLQQQLLALLPDWCHAGMAAEQQLLKRKDRNARVNGRWYYVEMSDLDHFEQDIQAALTAVMKNPDCSCKSPCVICFVWLKLDSESLGPVRL